jgi:hypothetical protein
MNDEDADVLYEELARYEHEHDLDPFDVDICLQQMDRGATHQPRKVTTQPAILRLRSQRIPPSAPPRFQWGHGVSGVQRSRRTRWRLRSRRVREAAARQAGCG